MAVSIKFSGRGGSVAGYIHETSNTMIEEINKIIEEQVKRGEEITKENISTRGTAKSGKAGRIETGKMLDSVSSEFQDKGRNGSVGEFGWLGSVEDYFKYQEDGFDHVNGVRVDGMYALSDAEKIVVGEIIDRVEGVVRGS